MKQLKYAILGTTVALSACASIIKGGEQTITIASTPEAAEVRVVNRAGQAVHQGATPMTVALKKGAGYFEGENYVITVGKPGYGTQTINLTSSANGWYIAGNLLFGGLIGYLIVDPITGAMWTLSPETVNASLTASHAANETSMTIVLASEVPAHAWANATPVN